MEAIDRKRGNRRGIRNAAAQACVDREDRRMPSTPRGARRARASLGHRAAVATLLLVLCGTSGCGKKEPAGPSYAEALTIYNQEVQRLDRLKQQRDELQQRLVPPATEGLEKAAVELLSNSAEMRKSTVDVLKDLGGGGVLPETEGVGDKQQKMLDAVQQQLEAVNKQKAQQQKEFEAKRKEVEARIAELDRQIAEQQQKVARAKADLDRAEAARSQ